MNVCCGLVSVGVAYVILLSGAVRSQFQPIKNPVYWGPWSDWSSCSSTCGQGVMSKTRDCLEWNQQGAKTVEQWNCRGRARRQQLCHGTECDSTNSADTKDECWSLNARGRIYFQHWEQVETGNPCQIVCREKNSGVQRMAQQIEDGTVCSKSLMVTRMCRGGKCLVPDEWSCVDSNGHPGVMDMCLICGGDNSSCVYLEGSFGHLQSLTGEINMIDRTGVRIPRGSTFIRVEKFGTAPNTLALIDSYGQHIINAKSWASNPGIYTGEGSKWKYDSEISHEMITATGPTIGDVAFKLMTFAPRQSVKFSFWGAIHLHPHLASQWGVAWQSAPESSDRRLESFDDVWWDRAPKNESDVNLVDVDIGPISSEKHHLQPKGSESVVFSIPKSSTTTLTPTTTEEEANRHLRGSLPESHSGVSLHGSKVDRLQTNIATDNADTAVDSRPLAENTTKIQSPPPDWIDPTRNRSPHLVDTRLESGKRGKPRENTKGKRRKKTDGNKSSNKKKRPKKEKKPKRRKTHRRRLRDSSFTLRPSESCFPCPRIKARPKLFCASDFVSKVYVNRRKTVKQETRYDVTVLSSYRNRVKLMQREFIWVQSRCRCPNMKAKRTYILTGNMKARTDRETRLVIDKTSFVRGFSVGSDRRMQEMAQTVNC